MLSTAVNKWLQGEEPPRRLSAKNRRPAKIPTALKAPKKAKHGQATTWERKGDRRESKPQKGHSHPWRKSSKHKGKTGETHQQQKGERGTAARAPAGGNTKQTKQKHDPSHDVERHTEGRAAPKKPPTPTAGKGDERRRAQSSCSKSWLVEPCSLITNLTTN